MIATGRRAADTKTPRHKGTKTNLVFFVNLVIFVILMPAAVARFSVSRLQRRIRLGCDGPTAADTKTPRHKGTKTHLVFFVNLVIFVILMPAAWRVSACLVCSAGQGLTATGRPTAADTKTPRHKGNEDQSRLLRELGDLRDLDARSPWRVSACLVCSAGQGLDCDGADGSGHEDTQITESTKTHLVFFVNLVISS
ncbi:MAG TPA: hypothetical protein VFK57_18620 [Vicinamibacterales bacterium]|nr:hypothetical protein [Vicinamibacterales bacterium]